MIGTTYGSGNGSTTFNLPNLADKVIQGNATAGTTKAAGLPNITGTTTNWSGSSDSGIAYRGWVRANGTGAFQTNSVKGEKFILSRVDAIGSDFYFLLNDSFDASRSSSIYGNSTTVQPPAVTMKFAIYSGVVSKKLWLRTV